MEIFNELSIAILTYIYIYFKNSFTKDFIMGNVYISIYMFCVFVNLINLFWNVLIDQMKEAYKNIMKNILWVRYEYWKY